MTSVTKCDKRCDESVESEAAEAVEAVEAPHIPLYERIHDMFPDIKPQQSMAAWDDDCPF